MAFCKDFNAKSASQGDMIIPVVITVYSDRSFSFIMKTPPASGAPQEGGRARHDEEAGQRRQRAEQEQGRQDDQQAVA